MVTVDTWISPDPAMPGDTVEVAARIEGCAQGEVVAQVLRETNDGEFLQTSLAAQQATTAGEDQIADVIFTITDALRGWYGVRVVCGEFRSELRAMAGSYFPVGGALSKPVTISDTTLEAGESLDASGSDCPGQYVEYDISKTGRVASVFDVEGEILVDQEGNWSAEIEYPRSLGAGRTDLSVRCVVQTPTGELAYDYYDRPPQVIVT